MKTTVLFLVFSCLIGFGNALHAQTINMPADRLEDLLCKKWVAAYALMGTMRVEPGPGAVQIMYEFKRDNTFLLTNNQQGKTTQGTWNYDSGKGIVVLNANGAKRTSIIALTDTELFMLMDTRGPAPQGMESMKMVYKVMGQ